MIGTSLLIRRNWGVGLVEMNNGGVMVWFIFLAWGGNLSHTPRIGGNYFWGIRKTKKTFLSPWWVRERGGEFEEEWEGESEDAGRSCRVNIIYDIVGLYIIYLYAFAFFFLSFFRFYYACCQVRMILSFKDAERKRGSSDRLTGLMSSKRPFLFFHFNIPRQLLPRFFVSSHFYREQPLASS